VEMWSSEQFDNYVKFLQMTVLNPHIMAVAPVPYVGERDQDHPLQVFIEQWQAGYTPGAYVLPAASIPTVILYEPS